MGRIVERQITDTAYYAIVAKVNGKEVRQEGALTLREATLWAQELCVEGANFAKIYSVDYLGVERYRKQVTLPKGTKCDSCREFKQDVDDYYRGDTSNFYCLACATELGEV